MRRTHLFSTWFSSLEKSWRLNWPCDSQRTQKKSQPRPVYAASHANLLQRIKGTAGSTRRLFFP